MAANTPNETGAAPAPTLDEEVNTLKRDLVAIKDDLALMADTVRGRAQTRARDARDMAQARYQESVDSVEGYIEEKPITTVLVAFGVGLLLGKLFSLK